MKQNLKLWFIRIFAIILTKEKAIKLGLSYNRTVYGDEINFLECREIWTDLKGRLYFVVPV